MNETLTLTFTTDVAVALATLTGIATVYGLIYLRRISSAIRENGRAMEGLSETIRRKNFKLKPEFDKRSGELKWADEYEMSPYRLCSVPF